MKKKILFFDTETTGLPPYNGNPITQWNEWPHVCQLSWTFEGKEHDYIIMPDGWTISPQTTAVHGISTERARKEGTPWVLALMEFIADAQNADMICAHNIRFDIGFIVANMIRSMGMDYYNKFIHLFARERQIDTMVSTINFMALPGKYGSYKWPKLEELYGRLFNGETYPAHDAMEDVRALERAYHELVKIGIL